MPEPYSLATRATAAVRARSIAISISRIYGVPTRIAETHAPVNALRATEPYLERGKLGYVMKKMYIDGYQAPIIVVRSGEVFYILDGHHRAYVSWLMGRLDVPALLIRFDEPLDYRPRFSLNLWELSTVEDHVPLGPRLSVWKFAAGVVVFYEKTYGGVFRLALREVSVRELVPTQKYLERHKLPHVVDEPILCIRGGDGRLYVLDGHARCYVRYVRNPSSRIRALILSPIRTVKCGVEDTAQKQGLSSFSDVVLV